MTLRRGFFIPGLLAAGMVLMATTALAQVDPPNVDPTHYWSYRLLDPLEMPASIHAQDQFFVQGVPVQIDRLERLVNWVRKNDSAVRDTFLHYTWWNIVSKHPMPRSVDVLNQFGLYPVDVLNLEFLLVPAWKNEPRPTAPAANHYLCYRAHGSVPPTLPLHFQDEWRFDQLPVHPMEFLCVPCLKEHNGVVYPPPDPVTHLAVYPIDPVSEIFAPFVMDQFASGTRLVAQTPPEYLFVPSEKFEPPTPAERSSWGRIKSPHR